MSELVHSADDYDFVAAHGRTHAVLGSGERVKVDGGLPAGAGVYLVAGTAVPGGFERACELPAPRRISREDPSVVDPPTDLSPNGRWLAVPVGDDTLTLHDLATGGRGFSFAWEPGYRARAVHPGGDCLACRTPASVKLLLPDGQVWSEASFPRSEEKYPVDMAALADSGETLTFSACGRYLWFTHVGPRQDGLLLLEVPGLKVLDRVGHPSNPRHDYDDENMGWCEVETAVDARNNTLCIVRQEGDTLLSITFHAPRRRRIVTHPRQVDINHHHVNNDRINEVIFSADGKRFAGLSTYGMVFEGNTADRTTHAQNGPVDFGLGIYQDFGDARQIGYAGEFVLALGDDNHLHILQSGSLEWKGLHTFDGTLNLLPDGTLLRTCGGTTDVLRLRLTPKPVPVVFEIDAGTGLVRQILRNQRGQWLDATAEMAVTAPNFRFAR